jgi:hypothetical protein
MNPNRLQYSNLDSALQKWPIKDVATRDHVLGYLLKQKTAPIDEWRRRPAQMFWPPRIVKAVNGDSLTVFFGSGISLAAGIPDWMGLLTRVGLDPDVERDPTASGDLLTLAELAAHAVGADPLQATIRNALRDPVLQPTTAHCLVAALYTQVLLTTNYDSLLEIAFQAVQGKKPMTITNDLDVKSALGPDEASWDKTLTNSPDSCFLIKLHGCVERPGEHLILTRSDYRRHYRSNPLMLELVRHILETRHTLFLGFSHRDPEVARIIEDVIYQAQKKNPPGVIPGFYSLQFDMLQKTPEIFAARGIVALQPPLVLPSNTGSDARACSLAQGLTDLFDNADQRLDIALSLDHDLQNVATEIAKALNVALARLNAVASDALAALSKPDSTAARDIAESLVVHLGEFASQGAYLVNRHGRIVASGCPSGLKSIERQDLTPSFEERPYFRLAQSNRKAFVSDVFESKFNKNATLAACLPLLDGDTFRGLLFTAFQLNKGGLIEQIRMIPLTSGASLLVTDANGVLVIPPEKVVEVRIPDLKDLAISSEDPSANGGYSYWELLQVSRRDKRIDRLMQNIVPLSQDDDVFPLAADTVAYSVVTELDCARWKVALTRSLRIRQ